MKQINRIRILLVFLIPPTIIAQTTFLKYELNGMPSNKIIQDSIEISKNPFAKFIGEWTLKDNDWTQNWGGKTEVIKIKDHHTLSSQINTENSLFSIIDGPEPNGHIFWIYDSESKKVHHLSSFGKKRLGRGTGTISDKGDITLKIIFSDEPKGTYRIYRYKWISNEQYLMTSVQYNLNEEPTGLFYQGNFVRIH